MKILILGDGVIGTVYGHELSVAGYDVTHLIRKERAEAVRDNGIKVRCMDYRNGKKKEESYLYKPKVIDQLSVEQDFDLFMISAKSNNLEDTLKFFGNKISPNTTVLIFQSLWSDTTEIKQWLHTGKIVYGFPHIMGGGKDENGIYCTIFGNKDAPTMLGTDTEFSMEKLKEIAHIFENARMNPCISSDILGWIYTHYAEAAGLLAGVMQSDNYIDFASDKEIVRKTLFAIREGLRVCKARGIRVNRIKPQCYYFLPTFIMIPFMKAMYSTDGAKLMIKGHITHSLDEMKYMVYEIISSSKKYNVETPYLEMMRQKVEKFSI